ncbi:MAG: hypothetical protein HOY71_18960, partial [Nonomuraea sp.]|nr:hypothetical protein [Nonomuraea sp.]
LRQVQGELGLSVTDLVGMDPGPGPAMSTVPRTRSAPSPFAPEAQHAQQAQTPQPAPRQEPSTGAWMPQAVQETPPTPVYVQQPAQHGPLYPPQLETVEPYQPHARSSRLGLRLAIGASVGAVAIASTVFAVYLSRQNPQQPPTPTPTHQAKKTTAPTPIDKRTIAALAPRQVKVIADAGSVVKLRWTLPTGSRGYPVVLQRSPVKAGEQPITPLGQGATDTKVVGLDPKTGYCFVVGVPLQISKNSTVAWSKPACIRGAVAEN